MNTTSPDFAYYFGYGTLLGTEAMREYCPTAEKVMVGAVADRRLEFWSYNEPEVRVGCHLAEAPGAQAYGVVYKVSDAEIRELDAASGVEKNWFRREPIVVTDADGTSMEATTYFLVAPIAQKTPPEAYSGLVRTGSHTAGLPADYVRTLTEFLDGLPPVS